MLLFCSWYHFLVQNFSHLCAVCVYSVLPPTAQTVCMCCCQIPVMSCFLHAIVHASRSFSLFSPQLSTTVGRTTSSYSRSLKHVSAHREHVNHTPMKLVHWFSPNNYWYCEWNPADIEEVADNALGVGNAANRCTMSDWAKYLWPCKFACTIWNVR